MKMAQFLAIRDNPVNLEVCWTDSKSAGTLSREGSTPFSGTNLLNGFVARRWSPDSLSMPQF